MPAVLIFLACLLLCLPTVSQNAAAASQPLSEHCRSADAWQTLFDGSSLQHWELAANGPAAWYDRLKFWQSHGEYGGWEIDAQGHLYRGSTAGDLRSRADYGNFELALEWKISPGGNSGIKLRLADVDGKPANTDFEMQVLDNAGHSDGASPLTSAGALYGLYPAPAGDYIKPAGEWNRVRILLQGRQIEFYLNGQQTVAAEIASPQWQQRLAKAPHRRRLHESFALHPRGRITLQDHFDDVWYRNIRICELPD